MSLSKKIKRFIPTSSDPEPKANVSGDDFNTPKNTDGDSDTGNNDGDSSSEDSSNQNTSGETGEDGADSDNQSDRSDDTSSEEIDSDGAESGATGDEGQPSDEEQSTNVNDGESKKGDTDHNNESGSEQNNKNGDEQGKDSDSGKSSGSDGQNSLFDYEDLEQLADGENENNATDSSEDDNSPNEENGESDDNSSGNEEGDDERQKSEEGDEDSEEGENTGSESEKEKSEENGDNDGIDNENGEGESDGDDENDETGGDINNGSQFPEDIDEEDESGEGKKEFEPDNEKQERTDSDPFEPHPGMVEKEEEQIDNEKHELESEIDGLEQEIEKIQQALKNDESSDNASGGDIDQVKMNTTPSTRTSDPRWKECMNEKEKKARLLRQRLERSRRDSYRRGKKNGMVDGMSLGKVAANQLDVFKQYSPGDDKEYAVIISIDRSGSMGGDDIDIAERATVQFALAMEDIGIDVSIIEMYRNDARVVLPFNVSVATMKGDLLTRNTGGGTPLTQVIRVAKERMKNSEKFPVILSITDGSPDKPEEYLNEVKGCNMPVMGMTVGRSGGRISNEADRYYDVHRSVSSVDELTDEMEKMIMKITF